MYASCGRIRRVWDAAPCPLVLDWGCACVAARHSPQCRRERCSAAPGPCPSSAFPARRPDGAAPAFLRACPSYLSLPGPNTASPPCLPPAGAPQVIPTVRVDGDGADKARDKMLKHFRLLGGAGQGEEDSVAGAGQRGWLAGRWPAGGTRCCQAHAHLLAHMAAHALTAWHSALPVLQWTRPPPRQSSCQPSTAAAPGAALKAGPALKAEGSGSSSKGRSSRSRASTRACRNSSRKARPQASRCRRSQPALQLWQPRQSLRNSRHRQSMWWNSCRMMTAEWMREGRAGSGGNNQARSLRMTAAARPPWLLLLLRMLRELRRRQAALQRRPLQPSVRQPTRQALQRAGRLRVLTPA